MALRLRQLSGGFYNAGDGLLAIVSAVFPKSRRTEGGMKFVTGWVMMEVRGRP
jgi:hypothetical protein